MTGPEHYEKAEQLLDKAQSSISERTLTLAAAQVHALLAVASALAPTVVTVDELVPNPDVIADLREKLLGTRGRDI
jgi:hypothetical protein